MPGRRILVLTACALLACSSSVSLSQADSAAGSASASAASVADKPRNGPPKGESLPPEKSYAYYVGENLTADGSVLLGGSGEEVSSHWLEIVPHQQHPADAKVQVGVTSKATYPGKLFKIPQAEETYKYISMTYTQYRGLPAPLTNGGLNEKQVAARDVWSPSRQELTEMTPQRQRGLNYSDLARLAMQRAKTAEEAARLVGNLVDKHGYATYGFGNTNIFADPKEGWVVKEYPGGKGLWVAERLGPDEVRVSYPGYIKPIPRKYIDFENLRLKDNSEFMASDNFISFAVKQGWYDPDSQGPFKVHDVYGAQDMNLATEPKLMSPKEIERELSELTPVTVDEMMELVRDPRITDDQSGYGQVAHLREVKHPGLGLLWVAPTGSVTAPFIPWRIGVQQAPPEYRQHRYLTKDSASTFLDDDYQLQEATRFVGRVYKQLMYYTCAHPAAFLPGVTKKLEKFEEKLLDERKAVEEKARKLYGSGHEKRARQYLTKYSRDHAMEGLELGERLVSNVGKRTKERYGIPEPPEDDTINFEGQETTDDVDCLAVPGVDPDVAGDVPARKWRTGVPGVQATRPQGGVATGGGGASEGPSSGLVGLGAALLVAAAGVLATRRSRRGQ